MPGMTAFGRKWGIGSDDLWMPAVVMLFIHILLVLVLAVSLAILPSEVASETCVFTMESYTVGFILILAICIVTEASVLLFSMRGSISHTELRNSIPLLVYLRLGMVMVQLFWLVLGLVWMTVNYYACADLSVLKGFLFGAIICCWLVLATLLSVSWYFAAASTPCALSSDGNGDQKCVQTPCSVSINKEICPTKSVRECRMLDFVSPSVNKHSLLAATRLFSCLLRDNDLVHSDVYAGVLLLQRKQKAHRACVLAQNGNEVYEFLSGVPITPSTRFVSLRLPEVQHNYKKTVHFMSYCISEYRHQAEAKAKSCWLAAGTAALAHSYFFKLQNQRCRTASEPRCCCWPQDSVPASGETVLNDKECVGCMRCIAVPLFHKEITTRGKLSFSISVDHVYKAVVVTVSADIFLQELLKGLGADSEPIPVDPEREDWHAQKDMLQLALDVQQILKDELLLTQAFCLDPEKGTGGYSLILVGHSLGAGVAVLLSILLRSEYPSLHCYAYSPPGSLLSATCAEETKAFITSVVIGKDVFPRFGVSQLESFEKDLINAIKKSIEPKWKIVIRGLLASFIRPKTDASVVRSTASASVEVRPRQNHRQDGRAGRCFRNGGSPVLFSMQTALYPPGRIMHIVRSHPKVTRRLKCCRKQVIYQAVWAENADFDQILVSPTMLSDHQPEVMFDAMKKVMTRVSPSKPSRKRRNRHAKC